MIVDEVTYFDSTPWPAGTDGTGVPLQRKALTGCGNDPASWGVPLYDRDGDGVPDAREDAHLGDTNAPPLADGDGDGMKNGDEYVAGTDPADSNSVFRIELTRTNGVPLVRFRAREATGVGYSGLKRYYSLEFTPDLVNADWQPAIGSTNILGADQTVLHAGITNRVMHYRARTWLDNLE